MGEKYKASKFKLWTRIEWRRCKFLAPLLIICNLVHIFIFMPF